MATPLQREIIFVAGMTGQGKTQWTKHYIRAQKRVIIADPVNEYYGKGVLTFDRFDELIDHCEKSNIFRVAYTDLRDFDNLALLAKSIPSTLLVVEESQRIIPPRVILPVHFEDVIYRGRHTGTSVLLVAQRPSTVDIAVRSQFNTMIVFRQQEPRDIAWIKGVSGFDIDKEIMALEPLEYLEINNRGYEKKRLTGIIK